MAKKKLTKKDEQAKVVDMSNIDDIDPKIIEKARKETRAAMKEKFDKWIEVFDEDASDEFLQETKKDFQEQVDKYQNQTYKLADAETALRTAEFLKNFNEKHNSWEKGSWRGIIMFNKVINQHIADLTMNTDKAFEIDYSTLIFLYNAMANPHGIGLESARQMAEMENYDEINDKAFDEDTPVTYSGILEKIFAYVRELAVVDKMLKLYQERINIAAAGIKFNFKITELEEFKQLHDAWVTDGIPSDPAELNKYANS